MKFFKPKKIIYRNSDVPLLIRWSLFECSWFAIKLPPNPTKLTDTRSNGYIKKFGKTCWEVDALKPQVLTSLVESHVEEQIDMDLYNQSMAQEAEDLEKLQSFIDTRE